MEFINPLKFSGLKIRKFLIIIWALQIFFLSSVYIDLYLIQIPLVRAFFSFIYLSFVPGALIIRLLKMREISNLESFLYTIGSSLAFIMIMGITINLIFSFFGILNPLSIENLILFFTFSTLVLSFLVYKTDNSYEKEETFVINSILNPKCLFLLLIPFLSIFASYVLNYNNSINLMILTLLIIPFAFIYLAQKKNSNNVYIIAVFVFSIALLYHKSLITSYVFGSDIHIEQHLASLVIKNFEWNSNIELMYNSMISVTILGPVYSIISGLNLHVILKVIYPFFTAMIPLGLYQVYKTQTNNKFAFISVFLFISASTFYGMLLETARQQIAELFFVLLILMIIRKKSSVQSNFLLVLFALSIAVSHYGLNYLFLIILAIYFIMKILLIKTKIFKISKINRNEVIGGSFIVLIFVFSLFWYMYTAGSITFDEFFKGFFNQFLSGLSDLFNPDSVEGLYIVQARLSFTRNVTKYLYLISQFFIFLGVILSVSKFKTLKSIKLNLNPEYVLISLIFLLVLIMGLVFPATTSKMSTYRTFHIALVFLSPFFILGISYLMGIIKKIIPIKFSSSQLSIKIATIFLFIFFIFNTGLANHALEEEPSQSISLDPTLLHPLKLTEEEYYSTIWLNNYDNNVSDIYVDNYGRFVILNSINDINRKKIFSESTVNITNGSYIYLNYLNSIENQIESLRWETRGSLEWKFANLINSDFYNQVLQNQSKIYDNNASQIFIKQ